MPIQFEKGILSELKQTPPDPLCPKHQLSDFPVVESHFAPLSELDTQNWLNPEIAKCRSKQGQTQKGTTARKRAQMSAKDHKRKYASAGH